MQSSSAHNPPHVSESYRDEIVRRKKAQKFIMEVLSRSSFKVLRLCAIFNERTNEKSFTTAALTSSHQVVALFARVRLMTDNHSSDCFIFQADYLCFFFVDQISKIKFSHPSECTNCLIENACFQLSHDSDQYINLTEWCNVRLVVSKLRIYQFSSTFHFPQF